MKVQSKPCPLCVLSATKSTQSAKLNYTVGRREDTAMEMAEEGHRKKNERGRKKRKMRCLNVYHSR